MFKTIVFALMVAFTNAVSAATPEDGGPKFDLIFGVNVDSPDIRSDVSMHFYLVDDVLQVAYEPAPHGSVHSWTLLYRYDWKTKTAVLLPTPEPRQFVGAKVPDYRIPVATENLRLHESPESPDGYRLAQPKLIGAGPLEYLATNAATLLMVGKTGPVTTWESTPRLEKGDRSFLMKSKEKIFDGELQIIIPLGWVKQ